MSILGVLYLFVLSDQEKLAAARRYAAATRLGDAAAYAAGTEPDAVAWHNFDGAEAGPERTARTLRWLHATAPDVTWTDIAVIPTANGFVWQALMAGTAPAGVFSVHTCMVVTLSSRGLVTRTDEYLDPAALSVLHN
ncbi:MAG: nuclear transport factor 2 family protein [Ilumatobacteraceae bacterium]|nr:nuclear transport factor 2 family protein [Ilumatobacteraceae bacterium]